MTAVNPPFCLQAAPEKHPAQLFRQAISSFIGSTGGVIAKGALEVTQKGTPNMSVIVAGGDMYEGGAWIPGNVSGYAGVQGLYYVYNNGDVELAVEAANATNPRVDTVVAVVKDEQYEGTENEWALEVLKGTAESGATLSNRKGAAALPKNVLVLAYVLVPAKATSIVTADIENVVGSFNSSANGPWAAPEAFGSHFGSTSSLAAVGARLEQSGAVVRLRGGVEYEASGEAPANSELLKLPSAYRPAHEQVIACALAGTPFTFNTITVAAGGGVFSELAVKKSDYVALDGLTFPLD